MDQQVDQPASLPVVQPIGQPISQPIGQPNSQPSSQSAGQLADQPVSQTVSQSENHQMSQPDFAQQQAQQNPQTSPQRAIVTKVRLTDELNIFDWFRTKDIINQLAEKAKSSVDSVITVLDPGMKEYLYSGGNINIIVICDSGSLVSPVRDAFQLVFGRATVNPSDGPSEHPVKLARGFKNAVKVAQERVTKLRLNTSGIPQNQVVVVIQPCIVSLDNEKTSNIESASSTSPERGANDTKEWSLTYCMMLEDPVLNITLSVYSQIIPIDPELEAKACEKLFKEPNYSELGYATFLSDLMNDKLGIKPEDNPHDAQKDRWLRDWTGLDEAKIIHDLSSTLAYSYKRKWNECVG